MNRGLLTILAGVVAAVCLAPAPASAGISIRVFPPSAYIATSRPVYYQNRATYWYQGRWHYRDGRNWQTYRTEPRYLRGRRNKHRQQRFFYGRDRW